MKHKLQTNKLNNGSFLTSCVIEVAAIPDASITAYAVEDDVRNAYASDLIRTISSIADIYKSYSTSPQANNVAVELLWIATPTEHQTYAAKIRLFLFLRSIASNQKTSELMVEHIADAFAILLETDRYSFDEIDYPSLQSLLREVSYESKQSIIRNVRTESLPLPALQQCAHFDCFDHTPPALEIMVNALIKSPKTLVSIQLIPTSYAKEESQLISSVCQTLGMLSSGVNDPSFGLIPVVAAQKCIDTYSYYHSQSNKALFSFNVSIYGPSETSGLVTFAVQSVMSGAGRASLSVYPLNEIPSEAIIQNYEGNPWMLSQYLHARYPAMNSVGFDRLPYLISAEETVAFFSLPIGGNKINAGFSVDYSLKDGKEYRAELIDSGDLSIGKLKSTGGRHVLGISKNDLTKHMLIVGTPGSGKTTFSVGMLDRLWKQGIPFLVIEPAKNEYRALVRSIPDLQIFTPGKNSISPFVFNPFVPPENVQLESYKPTLKTAFSAGVSMTTPLDKIFEETINNCYADFDWLDTYTTADKGKTFNISDFIKCFKKTFESIGYTGEVGNIGKAGVVRLKGLTNLFDNYYSLPIGDLLSKPTVIELAAIENSDEKALIIALLLLSILSYVNANYEGDSGLRNVILLEEAHVLLDSQTNASQGEANPSAIAQGLVKRMLAELRSYGISLVIADQSPRKVSTDVVALTDIKLAFRLVENVDKQIISDSTNMTDQQAARLSRLRPGEAFFFFNKLEEPEEVITENYRIANKIDITLADAEIARLSTYWKSRQQLLRPYPECAYASHCTHSCNYSNRILAREIARRIFVEYILSAKPNQPTQGKLTKQDIVKAQYEAMRTVFSNIVKIARSKSNGEPITHELLACIKLHLFRRIKYETDIPLHNDWVEKSIMNS